MSKTKYYISGTMLAVALLLVGVWVRAPRIVHAEDTNFSDGITVDSTQDTGDDNIGDNICDDGDGNCTLRAAIQESNATVGTQTIKFNIAETADFTIGVQSGYTISPDTQLPPISSTVIIDGYTQPGSLANTTEAPNPMNGRLLIEIEGSQIGAGSYGSYLAPGSDGSIIKGMVLNRFQSAAFSVRSGGNALLGNYVGTDPTGMIATGNHVGMTATEDPSNQGVNLQVGGLNPADRNIFSGNTVGLGATAMYPASGAIVQGNYLGVGADGLTNLGNSATDITGSGILSIDNADDVVVGGADPAAINIISGSHGHGIAPDTTDNILIEGNYIGYGYDGVTVIGNGIGSVGLPSGIAISNSTNLMIKNNKIVDSESGVGITISLSSGGVVQGNEISGSFSGGVTITGSSNMLVGGTQPEDANSIFGNGGFGIVSATVTITGFGTLPSTGNSIIGNSIYDNDSGELFGVVTNGLGIDLADVTLTGQTPTGLANGGSTPNDAGDADTGSNGYINFPVLNSAKQTGTSLALNYDLNAADSPSDEYRVEFFANDTADPSGYGEGQTFLGAVTASNGDGNTATLMLPSGMDLTSKVISATTTAIDDSTDSGFASTSEFSAVLGAEVIAAETTNPTASAPSAGSGGGNLGETGQKIISTFALAIVTVGSIVGAVRAARKKQNFKA